MQNAYGSEFLDLPIVANAQYWNGTGYVMNTQDSCTSLTVPSSGAGMVSTPSGLATNVTASMSVPLVAGDAGLKLAKPGAGPVKTGYVTVTLTVPAWLQFEWLGGAALNPTARATFGVYKSPLIYRRENY